MNLHDRLRLSLIEDELEIRRPLRTLQDFEDCVGNSSLIGK